MKNVCLASVCGVLFFVYGCAFYTLYSQHQRFGCVDINQMIHRTAEGLAKRSMKEEQLQLRLQKFKKDLSTSLDEFAHEQRVMLIPSHLVHGNIPNMTEAFVAYHNGARK